MKFTILGAGSWGTALGEVLLYNGHEVLLYHHKNEVVEEINNNKTNSKFFNDLKLNQKIKCTNNLSSAVNFSNNIIFCVPSANLDSLINEILKLNLKKKLNILNTIKGFSPNNTLLIRYYREKIPSRFINSITSLIGPSHAEEVIIKQLTCITSVSKNLYYSKFWQKVFSNDYFRVYTSSDEIGAEICASYKNAVAIGSGIAAGMGFKDNARAAYLTRALAEMMRFGKHFNGKTKTFLGLAGVGDLIVTCNSLNSRNFNFGYLIGKHNSIDYVLKNYTKTVEGYRTIKAIYEISQHENIDLPIINALYKALYEQSDIEKEIKNLMLRPLKKEF